MPNDPIEPAIPLFEEQLDVRKTEVVSDRLRVTTSVDKHALLIEEILERGHLQVERVAVDRLVTEAPPPRQDGDTLVVSVVEERLVVEKRLFVVEEVRITRGSTTERVAIPETVRRMRATVEHAPTPPSGRETDG